MIHSSDRQHLPETATKTGVHDHICLLYRTTEEQFEAVMPYMAEGLRNGEQGIYLADEHSTDAIRRAMRSFGIDVATATKEGRLLIVTKQETYLKRGYFDPDWMIDLLRDAVGAAAERGATGLRAAGEMTWSLNGARGSHRLGEYESKLNDFYPNQRLVGLCQYNLNRFPPETIREIIRTHPVLATRTLVCRNYYYKPPNQFPFKEDTESGIDQMVEYVLAIEREERKAEDRAAKTSRN